MNGVQVRIGARPSAFGVRRIRSFVLCRKAFFAGAVLLAVAQTGGVSAEAQEGVVYRPKLAVPETLQPFLKHLESGNDAFPAERQARELEARLLELAESLRGGPDRAAKIAGLLLHKEFRGGRLLPASESATTDAPLELRRSNAPSSGPSLDSRAFASELRRLVEDLREVTVTELLITSIDTAAEGPSPLLRTDVRYDIVGIGLKTWRVEHVGVWKMSWRKDSSGWQVAEWTTASHLTSRARSPIFTEVTAAVLGSNDSFGRQLSTRSRRVDGHVRFGADTRFERPSWCIGWRCRWRRAGRSLRCTTCRPPQSSLPGPG